MSNSIQKEPAGIAETCAVARTLLGQGQAGEALKHLKPLLESSVDQLEPQYLAAEAEFASGAIEAAIARLLAAIQKTPSNNPMLYKRLGDMFSSVGRIGDSQSAYRHAIGLIPRNQNIPTELLQIFLNSTGTADFEALRLHGDMWEFFFSVPSSHLPSLFLRMFPYASTIEENRKFLALLSRYAKPFQDQALANPLPGEPVRYDGGVLRIALLSSLFSNNNVAKFLLPVLDVLSEIEDVEVYYFSTIETINGDAVQSKVKNNVNFFEDVSNLDPRAVAHQIRMNSCHVVIDMDGYARWSKTAALNYRSCSLQVSWMNWPGTLGMEGVDAIIVDQFCSPGFPSMLNEKPIVMQGPYYVTGKLSEEAISINPPCKKNGYITFGTQSAVYKYTPALVSLWSTVLEKVESSRFLVVRPECANPAFRENIAKEFERNGVMRGRIDFVDNRSSGRSHMSHYNDIDIFLDSIPQTGGTTTMEALWMGVPVITYAGHNLHQRISHSLLCHLGLSELSGENSEDYIANAVELAHDPDRIAELKKELRARLCSSDLYNAEAFAAEFIDLLKKSLVKS